jgi:hypothetical protein
MQLYLFKHSLIKHVRRTEHGHIRHYFSSSPSSLTYISKKVKVKVKQSHYRPGKDQRFPGS